MKDAEEYLKIALGGNFNISTLKLKAWLEIMRDYANYYHKEKLKVDQEQSVQVMPTEKINKVFDYLEGKVVSGMELSEALEISECLSILNQLNPVGQEKEVVMPSDEDEEEIDSQIAKFAKDYADKYQPTWVTEEELSVWRNAHYHAYGAIRRWLKSQLKPVDLREGLLNFIEWMQKDNEACGFYEPNIEDIDEYLNNR